MRYWAFGQSFQIQRIFVCIIFQIVHVNYGRLFSFEMIDGLT